MDIPICLIRLPWPATERLLHLSRYRCIKFQLHVRIRSTIVDIRARPGRSKSVPDPVPCACHPYRHCHPLNKSLLPVQLDGLVCNHLKILWLVTPRVGHRWDLVASEGADLLPAEAVFELDYQCPFGRCGSLDNLCAVISGISL